MPSAKQSTTATATATATTPKVKAVKASSSKSASPKVASQDVTSTTVPVVKTAAKPRKPRPSKAAVVASTVVDVPEVQVTAVDVTAIVTTEVGGDTLSTDESVDDGSLATQFTDFLAKLSQVSGQFSALKTEFRSLEKKWTRELKLAQKASAKKKRKAGNRQPSGFVKPTLISTELAAFLDKPEGTEMARTEVTREINKYIRANDLQDPQNGRKINPDTALRALLKLKVADELTYFNLQRYMSPHFAKAGQAPLAGTTVEMA